MNQDIITSLHESGIVYTMPDYSTDAFEWQGHIPFAYWVVEQLQPELLVELGTYKGDSYCVFCDAIEKSGAKTNAFAIDTWEGDEHVGKYDSSIFDALRSYHDTKYSSFSRLLRMRFEDAVDSFQDGSIDLLHIDGLHTYEAVKNDFETWKKKLSSKSIVLFHDISVRERGFGVWKYWGELKEQYKTFEFNHSNGLGVLVYGKQSSAVLKKITALEEKELVDIQLFFQSLGDRVQKESQVDFWVKKKNELYAELDEYKRVDSYSQKLSQLEKEFSKHLEAVNVNTGNLVLAQQENHENNEYLKDNLVNTVSELEKINDRIGSTSAIAVENLDRLIEETKSLSTGVNNSVRDITGLTKETKSISKVISSNSSDIAGLVEEAKSNGQFTQNVVAELKNNYEGLEYIKKMSNEHSEETAKISGASDAVYKRLNDLDTNSQDILDKIGNIQIVLTNHIENTGFSAKLRNFLRRILPSSSK